MVDARLFEAVSAAWPDDGSGLPRFRRRIALELADIDDGPLGPHSSLSARITSTMRAKHPNLVREVCDMCSPPGKVRLKQLLAPGPGEHEDVDNSFEDPYGGSFLYWCQGQCDSVAVFDVAALLKWHGAGGPNTPPHGAGSTAGQRGGYGPGVVRPPLRAPYKRDSAGFREFKLDLSGVVPRYGTSGADLPSPYRTTNFKEPGSAEDAVADSESMVAVASLVDLGYMAFPGPSPASQLRRSLVSSLAAAKEEGLPPYTVPWRQLAPLVASSQAAALHQSLMKPATFRAFLQHPASAGVFAATRILKNPADPSSNVDCVTLSKAALRRAAPNGVAAAISAAWPGSSSWSQVKRAVAEVLLRTSSPAGPYTMNSGPLGNYLKSRRPMLYGLFKGSASGLMQRLDESAFQGFLVYVREDGKEGHLLLKIQALLSELPSDDGRDLGLRDLAATASLTLAAAATAAQSQNDIAQPAAERSGSASVTGVGALFRLVHTEGRDSASLPAGSTGAGLTSSSDFRESCTDTNSVPHDTWYTNIPPLPLPFPTTSGAPNPEEAGVTATSTATGTQIQAQAQVQTNCNTTAMAGFPACPAMSATPMMNYAPQALIVPVTRWVRTPSELEAALQHCYCAAAVGLAVHAVHNVQGGTAAVVAVYATGVAGVQAALDFPDPQKLAATWPPAVYLMDCTTLMDEEQMPGGGSAFRGLLESPYVAKVVHSCEQIACLATRCGAATISPILDIRVLLRALCAMLPPLPPPPPPSYGALGPLAAMTMAKLNAHVGALRDELSKAGLWTERADLMAALVGRHTAALREELFGSREWGSNPVGHEAGLAAAASHLPELWDALSYEAIPWVAMAAAANATAAVLNRPHCRVAATSTVTSPANQVTTASTAGGVGGVTSGPPSSTPGMAVSGAVLGAATGGGPAADSAEACGATTSSPAQGPVPVPVPVL